MSYPPKMPARLARFALVLGVSLLAAGQNAQAASHQRGALVRVEVIEADGTARTRTAATVAWDRTARVQLEVGGHAHALAITPSERDRGVALSVDLTRDGVQLADDLQLRSTTRRFVIEAGGAKVLVSVVPVTTHVETDAG